MQGVVIRRVVAKASTQLVKELPLRVVHAYLVPPAVFLQRSVEQATPSSFTKETVQPYFQPQQLAAAPLRKRGLWRRLRVVCAGAVTSLPVAIVKAVVVHGAQQLNSVAAFSSLSGVALGGIAVGIANTGIRRWHAARRSARRGLVSVNMGPAAELSVCTFNVRGIHDRWRERAPMLKQCLKQADADVYCFQEVLTGEFGQDCQLLGPEHQVHECRAALHNLQSTSLAGAAFATTVKALLGVSWTRSLLVSAPLSVETWREENAYRGNWSNLLSKLTVAPFFGNSIASRIPTVQPPSGLQHTAAAAEGGDAGVLGRRNGHPSSSSATGSSWWSAGRGFTSSSSNSSDTLVLGDFRAAQRVCFQLRLHSAVDNLPLSNTPQQLQQQTVDQNAAAAAAQSSSSGSQQDESVYLWLVNTHLDHAESSARSRQMAAILTWMEPLKSNSAGIVITGDLNAHPGEDVHKLLAQKGYFSTHKVAHGVEPDHTWPSGIKAPLMDADEPPYCADYIYAWQGSQHDLQVTAAQLCGDQPAADDQTLYPSDHFGIKVRFKVVARGAATAAGANRVQDSGSSSMQDSNSRRSRTTTVDSSVGV